MSNHQPVYWKMRNGKSIDIDSMDLNHLRNVLKMIVRNREKALQQLHKKVEFKLEGDMANEFNDSMGDIDTDELEPDLGYRFNDDEARGNQW